VFLPPGIEEANSAAEYINTQGYELCPDARAQADIKFTYVVSCQIYEQQKQMKKQEAADISLLLQRLTFLHFIFI
jgi:callose synthase